MNRPVTRSIATWAGLMGLAVVVAVSGRVLGVFASPATSAATPDGTNLVRNGSFDTLAPWSFSVRGGAAGTLYQDSTIKEDGTYSARVEVAQSNANWWYVQLRQGGIPISQGQALTISFWAKASAPRGLIVVLQQASAPYTEHFNRSVTTSTQWQNYTFTFTPAVSDPGALLAFNVAQATGQIWLDNVSLTAVAASSSPAPTGTAEPTSTPVATGTIPPTSTPVPPSTMPAPPGYANRIFEDTFSGTTLDSRKWIEQMADQNGIWTDNGRLPYPNSAVGNQGGYNAEYGNPDQVVVNDGLTLNAQRDTTFSGYSWKAGYVDTHGKFTFNHGYVQIRAKLPNSNTGSWAGFWFLEGGGEIDLDETGYTACGSNAVNSCIASNLHTSGNGQRLYNAGVDLSAGYHTYGLEYNPGQSVTMYLDGKQIAQFTSNVPTGAYTIILSETMATQSASGWHTVTSGSTPSPVSPFNVAEVQVWQ